MRRAILVTAVVLGARGLRAQAAPAAPAAREDSVGRVFPLVDIGIARSFPSTLARRSVTGTTSVGTEHESVRLRLVGQWGVVGEARLPVDRAKRWGLDLYGARFRGSARV